jgi:hypothetical protein
MGSILVYFPAVPSYALSDAYLRYKTVLAEMDRVGCDFCADVHGDETLPYNFLSGSEGLPAWGPRLKQLQDTFAEAYKKVRNCIELEASAACDIC